MSCFKNFAKYLIFGFNFLIVLCAIGLIIYGAFLLKDEDKLNESVFINGSVGGFAIGVGVIIFLIAFFGCYGAIKQNRCLLNTYAVILIILIIIEIGLAVIAFIAITDEDKFLTEIDKALTPIFNDAKDKGIKMDVVDGIQEYFECCGLDNQYFWPIPPESCKKNNVVYTTGCIVAVKDVLTPKVKIIAGVSVGFAVLELIGVVAACVIKRRQ